MTMRIWAVAMNTYREAVRDKVLYVLVFFGAVTILGSKALGWISMGEDLKIVIDISLAAVSVFGALIAIFVGTNLVYKEIEKRTIYTIISRPMARYEFVVGKFIGLALLLATVTLIMSGTAALYAVYLGGSVTQTFFAAVLLIYVKLLLVTALSVLLSSLTTPILAAIIVFCFYVLGHATGILIELPTELKESPLALLMEFLYFLVPNLSNFDIGTEAANGVAVAPTYTLWAVAYGAAYTLMLLILAAIAFENKDV